MMLLLKGSIAREACPVAVVTIYKLLNIYSLFCFDRILRRASITPPSLPPISTQCFPFPLALQVPTNIIFPVNYLLLDKTVY